MGGTRIGTWARCLGAAVVAAAVPVVLAAPAGASLTGDCAATGRLLGQGRSYDAASVDHVTLPLEDEVEWQGSVAGGDDGGEGPERQIQGEVRLKMPPGVPFGEITLGDWGPKQSTRYANGDTYEYSFPSILGGATVNLSGEHLEGGAEVCAGSVEIELEGSSGNPLLYGSLVITALSAAGLVVAARS
jgi:hypothetical protein